MMLNLAGEKYGKLTAICCVGTDKYRNKLWLCSCDCGSKLVVSATSLKKGHSKSCGCLKKDILINRNTKHGESKTHLYFVWASMKQRCQNKNNRSYKNYGGRGIYLWKDWLCFENFYDWAMKNGYKQGLDIDRIDNNSGYSPDNCRFVTRRENCMNKRDNVYVNAFGKSKTISEWSDITGISQKVIQKRLKRGWDNAIAIFAPIGTRAKNLPPDKIQLLKEEWGRAPADKGNQHPASDKR